MRASDHFAEAERDALRERVDDLPGESVGPRYLRAGDRVAYTYRGKRTIGTLVSAREGDALRSDAPDAGGYYPYVVFRGRWAGYISDVRLIERAPREDVDPDEALAKVIFGDAYGSHEGLRLAQLDVARAAREHIASEETDEPMRTLPEAISGRIFIPHASLSLEMTSDGISPDLYATLTGTATPAPDVDPDENEVPGPRERRLIAEVEVERLTRERDEARREARMHENAADDLRAHRDRHKADTRAATKRARVAEARHAALRADVETERDAARASRDPVSDGNLGWILDRDDERDAK